MKMIYKTLAVTLLLIVNACSTSDNDPNVSAEETKTTESKRSSEDSNEKMYDHYSTTEVKCREGSEASDAKICSSLAKQVKAFAGKLPKTKPVKPCGSNGNCPIGDLADLKGFVIPEFVENFKLDILDKSGKPVNAVGEVSYVELEEGVFTILNFKEPLKGNENVNLSFESNFLEEVVDINLYNE